MRVFGVVGWKNTGKTGLMERLVAEITGRGFSVSTLKHAHHSFDVDQPGKDSYRHRTAGATEVLLSSRNRWALMHENRAEEEAPLERLLARLAPVDLVLIEGYKRDGHPKVEAHRAETGKPLIAPGDPTVRAVASDVPLEGLEIPVFHLDDTAAVADFILVEAGLVQQHAEPAAPSTPPKLRDDCFALPDGVEWAPVDEVLTRLRGSLHPVVGRRTVPVAQALGRVLAADALALRSNPPHANSAVDGYGLAHAATGEGAQSLPLLEGRSAAGAPFEGTVPAGHAVRILTGALIPPGVDTIIMQEDVVAEGGRLAFSGPLKKGANVRPAGEDAKAGEPVLSAGQHLGPQHLALLTAVGCAEVEVYEPLRVGILSTGDEIVEPGATAEPSKTYDANRPMLLGLARKWGHEAVDLGHVTDDRARLRAVLDEAADRVDVILTSGGASAGEEDHVSALLEEAGALAMWRVAIKPGRPLALGMWAGVPVFGLPGNPVAAFVCALIFARPALSRLAGAGWSDPVALQLPAAFEKRKRPGRREYLRARMRADGQVEVYESEGSGRVSGLTWADGLVELEDEGRHIRPGDMVRYLPFSGFGL